MNFVAHVRGCSGAGKSTLVRRVVRDFATEAIYDAPQRSKGGTNYKFPIAWVCPGAAGSNDLVVLGRYHAEKGGGLDGVEPVDMRMLIDHFLPRGHILHESLMASAGGVDTGAWYDYRLKFGDDYHFIYLDTPAPTAVARIYQRNGGRQIKEEQVLSHHKSVMSSARRLKEVGASVDFVPHVDPYPELLNLLAKWGWTAPAPQEKPLAVI